MKSETRELLSLGAIQILVGACMTWVYLATAHGALTLILWALPGWTGRSAEQAAFGLWETYGNIEFPIALVVYFAWLWRKSKQERSAARSPLVP